MSKKYFYRIITILWICVIFSFSSQPASKSEKLSDGVGQIILEHSSEKTIEQTGSWSLTEWNLFYKVIRKAAHFTEFFILGICMMSAFENTGVVNKRKIALLLCILVAVTDETIQWFVPGRAARVLDVVIDGSGSFTGMSIYMLVTGFHLKVGGSSRNIEGRSE